MVKYRVKIENRTYEVEVEKMNGNITSSEKATENVVEKPAKQPKAPAPVAGGTEVKSPLGGTIISVKVKVGQEVKKGDVLLTLEALKLENEITAAISGTVSQIVSAGETVDVDHILAVIS